MPVNRQRRYMAHERYFCEDKISDLMDRRKRAASSCEIPNCAFSGITRAVKSHTYIQRKHISFTLQKIAES